MGVIRSSETSAPKRTTRHYFPEYGNIHKSKIFISLFQFKKIILLLVLIYATLKIILLVLCIKIAMPDLTFLRTNVFPFKSRLYS
jgi:hypothetical protein